jgi:methylphosphotriester-DNA--protein-cysteine methyltransferase
VLARADVDRVSDETSRFALGGYREGEPPPDLAPYAEALWIYRTPREATRGVVHRVVPDPALSIAFWCLRDDDGRVHEPRLTIIGPVATPRLAAFRPREEMAAVKLKLEWVRPLLDVAAAEHTDGVDPLEATLPALATAMLEPLCETRSAEDAVRAIVRTLRRASHHTPRTAARRAPTAANALELVRETGGRIAVERVADLVGRSARQLHRVVAGEAGISLKAYARAVRFVGTVTQADATREPHWARLAVERGYCDQSHLVRDFQAFTGMTPERLFRERRAEAEMSNRA